MSLKYPEESLPNSELIDRLEAARYILNDYIAEAVFRGLRVDVDTRTCVTENKKRWIEIDISVSLPLLPAKAT